MNTIQIEKTSWRQINENTLFSLTVVISLKSRQAPHTKRFTVASPETDLIWGKYSSTSFEISSRDSDVALSPVYLHLHSRHTLSKDIAPLARGTALVETLRVKALLADGAKAEVRATTAKMKATEVFMIVQIVSEKIPS